MSEKLIAGAAQARITPIDSQFLFGYPHVKRYSTGVYDQLLSSALYLSDGSTKLMFIANDIIFIPSDLSGRVRKRIEKATSIPACNIMVTATHSHSGPITVDYLSNEADPIVPKADAKYLQLMEDSICNAAVTAYKSSRSAELGLALTDATGIGTNRRDPSGPADLNVPVLALRDAQSQKITATMLICNMHPTVLHEDSTLLSGDFPGLARLYLQNKLSRECVVLHHTGPEGNQSPRHVTKANTFDEAEQLGEILGQAVEKALATIEFTDSLKLAAAQSFVELPAREFPSVQEAQTRLDKSVAKLDHLRKSAASRAEIRTAECDWFGAEETLTLAKAAADGRLEEFQRLCMPAEIQVFAIGKWKFAGWPGEIFIEFGLAVKEKSANTYVIALANGELQGYIVTPEADAKGGYEASNAMFKPQSGQILVDTTTKILRQL